VAVTTWTQGLLAAGLMLVALAVAEGMCRALLNWRPLRHVRISLRLLLYAGASLAVVRLAAPLLGDLAHPDGALVHTLDAAVVLMAVIAGARLLEALVVFGRFGAQAEAAVPTLARQIAFLALIIVAALWVLKVYFQTPPSTLLASSVVISAVVGLALQQTLGSVAAGVAIQSEHTFRLGDWVTIGEIEGEVVRMTWRTIHLRTRARDVVIIPNDAAARGTIINHFRPTREHGVTIEVGTHYRHSPDAVRAVLREAALCVPGVLHDPAPRVWTWHFGDFSITYRVKFFIVDYAAMHDIQGAVMSSIWYYFRRHRIEIPFPIRTVSTTQVTSESVAREAAERVQDIRADLQRADLFAPLADDEVEALARRVHTLTFGAGEVLFAQGDAGSSCYLIRRGRLKVLLQDEHGADVPLAELGPGALLGEMSLLTGAPRTAGAVALDETEVLCIGHADFAAVLEANPRIAESVAAIIESRRADTAAKRAAAAAGHAPPGEPQDRNRLVRQILRFFGITRS
jgi:small-conductance mechanosensitive channel/CRP-like cAMP-binding protein